MEAPRASPPAKLPILTWQPHLHSIGNRSNSNPVVGLEALGVKQSSRNLTRPCRAVGLQPLFVRQLAEEVRVRGEVQMAENDEIVQSSDLRTLQGRLLALETALAKSEPVS